MKRSPVAKQFIDPAVAHEPGSAHPKEKKIQKIQVPKAANVGEKFAEDQDRSTKG